eukprot:9449021-Karenia_brevis.AAC.1
MFQGVSRLLAPKDAWPRGALDPLVSDPGHEEGFHKAKNPMLTQTARSNKNGRPVNTNKIVPPQTKVVPEPLFKDRKNAGPVMQVQTVLVNQPLNLGTTPTLSDLSPDSSPQLSTANHNASSI